MKKCLIALAVAGACGAAMAQSSVTLYGVADVWVGKAKGSSAEFGSGGLSTSRLGFKGTEDLGGGLSVGFNFEQEIDLGNGAVNTKVFDRQANLSLNGAFGSLKLGRSFNAMDDIFGMSNSGFDSALSANAIWLNAYEGAADSQIYYATPAFGGFSAAVSSQLNGDAPAGRLTAFHVKYEEGPVAVALGYEENKANSQKGTMLNGSYDFGLAKLLASYYTTKNTGGTAGLKVNSYQIGADIPLSGALILSVGYAASKPSGGQTDSGFGIAAAYALSKRTTAYAGLRQESRKASNGQADQDFFAVGIRHTF
jgi:predicted porin